MFDMQSVFVLGCEPQCTDTGCEYACEDTCVRVASVVGAHVLSSVSKSLTVCDTVRRARTSQCRTANSPTWDPPMPSASGTAAKVHAHNTPVVCHCREEVNTALPTHAGATIDGHFFLATIVWFEAYPVPPPNHRPGGCKHVTTHECMHCIVHCMSQHMTTSLYSLQCPAHVTTHDCIDYIVHHRRCCQRQHVYRS